MDGIRSWIEAEGSGHWFFVAFPVCLLILFIWFKGRRVRFLIPSLIMSIVIINPWFYQKWDELGLYAYWRILWIIPVIPVVAGLVPSISEKFDKTWVKSIVAAVGVVIVAVGGTFIYNGAGGSFVEAANASKEPDYVVQIADRLLKLDEHPRVIAQDPIGVYLRQYTGEIDQLFGRDLYWHIAEPSEVAKEISTAINNGDYQLLSQTMLDEGYDFAVLRVEQDINDIGCLQLIDRVGEYGIYKGVGIPTVTKKRNELGQVIAVTTIDEDGQPINGSSGFSTIEYKYDDHGNISKEFHTDIVGAGVPDEKGIAGYDKEYDTKGRVVLERYLGSDGKPLLVKNYAEIHRGYNQLGWLISESYYDVDGNPFQQTAGHYGYELEYNNDGKRLSKTYFDDEGKPNNRIDGYSQIRWEKQADGVESIVFYDSDYKEISYEGINLAKNIDGWSEWMMPGTNVGYSLFHIDQVNLGKKRAKDAYTCQVEIEFSGVTAIVGEEFSFWSQGSTDNSWDIGNIWWRGIWLQSPPTDGIYKYTFTSYLSEEMAQAEKFNIDFRCDNWASGSFRIRNLKIEKGNTETKWSPGT